MLERLQGCEDTMKVNENSEVSWTKKVESTSSVRNPLGLWDHLNIQVEYVPGITSVTRRIRYYSLWAWYYNNLFEKRIINQKDFERLFILTNLAHHKGDHNHHSFSGLHNKERFKDDWTSIEAFKLDKNFVISGQGYSYYNAQLTKLRCYWLDQLNELHKSPINIELAKPFSVVNEDFFKQKQFTRKDILENLSGFCLCKKYPQEIDIMTKLFFGFIKHEGDEWHIDEKSYKQFMEEKILDLGYNGFDINTEEIMQSTTKIYQEMNQKRRNTLFMFLKIIAETNPQNSEMYKSIWNAIYFRQNINNSEDIDFKGLDKVLKSWELLQLNVYYVYSVEKIFDVIQEIVIVDNGILKEKLLSGLEEKKILDLIKNASKENITAETKIGKLIRAIHANSKIDMGLKAEINEYKIYETISTTDELEEILANVFVMLVLLKRRFETVDKNIIEEVKLEKDIYIKDKLRIDKLFQYLEDNKDQNIISFFDYLIKSVIERHLYESNIRLSQNGTKNWVFLEENSRLFISKKELITIRPRDNRWNSIQSLMHDIEMIKVDDKISLTDKGKQWLQQANLI